MSITVTTDVFCDGEDCSQWVHGVSGYARPQAAKARKEARRQGWTITTRRDLCPDCAEKARR